MTPPRCRWSTDDGRCLGHALDLPDAPELCRTHLDQIEPWIRRQARVMAGARSDLQFASHPQLARLDPGEQRIARWLLSAR